VEKLLAWLRIEPAALDLSSQTSVFDHSAKATTIRCTHKNSDNPVHHRLLRWLTQGIHLCKSHCRLLLPWLRMPCWCFCNPGLKICSHGLLGIEPTTLDVSSQSGVYDLAVMATPSVFWYFETQLVVKQHWHCLLTSFIKLIAKNAIHLAFIN